MTTVVATAKFYEKLIFDLLELLLNYAIAAEGVQLLDPGTIGVLRRSAETTEGFPSEVVRRICEEIFSKDIWEKLPQGERRPGVTRRFTADRLLASLDN
jgi:hypothetical protein